MVQEFKGYFLKALLHALPSELFANSSASTWLAVSRSSPRNILAKALTTVLGQERVGLDDSRDPLQRDGRREETGADSEENR